MSSELKVILDGYLNAKDITVESKAPPKLNPTLKSKMPLKIEESSTAAAFTRPKVNESSISAKISATTAYTDKHDIEMATRQIKYDKLTPQQQREQDRWAEEKMRTVGAPCPAGFGWIRVPGGYNCFGGTHWMSDELLVEGFGRFLGPYLSAC